MNIIRRYSIVSRLIIGLTAGTLAMVAVVPTVSAQGKKKKGGGDDDADRKANARDAYNKGTEAYAAGNYSEALDNFKRAQSMIPSPHAQYWIAQCQDKLGEKDEAIASYQALLASSEVDKIGQEKMDTAKARLEALRAPPAEEKPADTAPPAEEAPPPPPETTPVAEVESSTPPPETTSDSSDLKPKNGLVELGLLTGPIFVASDHNLQEMRYPHREYGMGWLVGLRAAFFPHKAFGIEAEYAHGWGSVKGPSPESDDGAQFNTVRGHLIGQLPNWRFVPFVLLGVGDLQATSARLGTDGDFMLEAGLGAKFAAGKLFTPRLDVRFDITQAEGGEFGDGITVHPEILLGLGLTLGR